MEDLIKRAAGDLVKAGYAIALTGAGISTESGIPDFRGPSGIWTRDPEAEKRAYQVYARFQKNPKEYWMDRLTRPSLLGNLGKMAPNPGHYALAELESIGILKWVITQNVDSLHQRAGSRKVLDYHGNAFKLRCFSCGARFESGEFDLPRLLSEDRLPPLCTSCGGVLKSDVVHFHEPIPVDVAEQSLEEAARCDLMLICGTSAVVYPFARLPHVARERSLGENSIIIEINAEPTPLTERMISDYLIQGKTGQILPLIVEEVKRLLSC
ncbi:MAG TPA: NAD-dependent deacylase [Thermodesulfobacteriota bacterium]|nr:NAD-dependent deacylase [Thermodesulfobacteriota bacterium]